MRETSSLVVFPCPHLFPTRYNRRVKEFIYIKIPNLIHTFLYNYMRKTPSLVLPSLTYPCLAKTMTERIHTSRKQNTQTFDKLMQEKTPSSVYFLPSLMLASLRNK